MVARLCSSRLMGSRVSLDLLGPSCPLGRRSVRDRHGAFVDLELCGEAHRFR